MTACPVCGCVNGTCRCLEAILARGWQTVATACDATEGRVTVPAHGGTAKDRDGRGAQPADEAP